MMVYVVVESGMADDAITCIEERHTKFFFPLDSSYTVLLSSTIISQSFIVNIQRMIKHAYEEESVAVAAEPPFLLLN